MSSDEHNWRSYEDHGKAGRTCIRCGCAAGLTERVPDDCDGRMDELLALKERSLAALQRQFQVMP